MENKKNNAVSFKVINSNKKIKMFCQQCTFIQAHKNTLIH